MSKTERGKSQKQEYRFIVTKKPNKNGQFAPTDIIPGECEVYYTDDKGKTEQRTAIYLPGQKTIWADEIPSLEKEKVIKGKSILFKNGFKVVNAREKNLLDFLQISGNNQANNDSRINSAILYRELDKEVLAANTYEKDRDIDKARYFISMSDITEVRAYALALAKNAAEYKLIQEMSEYEVRVALRPKAQSNPEYFIEGMQDLSLRHKALVIQGIYKDIVKLDEQERTLSWSDGGVFAQAPTGMDVVTYFSQMSIESPKHKESFNEIVSQVKGNSKEEVSPKQESQVKPKEPISKSVEDTLIDSLLEKGVLTVKSNNTWFKYKEGEDDELKWQTKTKLLKELKEDKALLGELMVAVM